MMAAVSRLAVPLGLAAVVSAVLFAHNGKPRVLDPNDPIAADGSLVAGRAHTIYDTNTVPGVFDSSRANSDDPADFEPQMEQDRQWAERDRSLFKSLRGRLDWSLCSGGERALLMAAVHAYYEERGREIAQYSRRGPHAAAAIVAEWSTPADRDIDDYIRHTLQYGILHKSDFSAKQYPEFAKTFADTSEFGAGCSDADIRPPAKR